MPGKYYLVLDAGTTAIKALVFDESLNLVSRIAHQMIKNFPQRNWVEQDPEMIIKASTAALRDVLAQAHIAPEEIISLGITNQRETIVAWDAATGQAVYPAIVWEDQRTGGQCAKLWFFGKEKIVRERTGLSLDPYFSATKIAWILKNVQQAKKLRGQRTLRVGTIDTWLLWRLSQNHQYKTDITNASRTLLFNINSGNWDSGLHKLFRVPEGLLATVTPSRADYGVLDPSIIGAAVPIRAMCGDQQASTFAAGINPDTTKVTYGTGAFLIQILGEKPLTRKGFFTTVVVGPGDKPWYALEAKVEQCGSRITPALGNEEELSEVFTQIAKEVNTFIKKLPVKPEKIIADGGAIRNPALTQIQAKISGIPVIEQKIFDGTGLGVAKLLASNRS